MGMDEGGPERGHVLPAAPTVPALSRLDRLGPPQAEGVEADAASVARIARYLALSRDGSNFTASLRGRKDFRNPCFLDKVVASSGIDPLGGSLGGGGGDPTHS
jgi:hypothetical protein